MKNFKRIISICVIVALLFSLSISFFACDNKDNTPQGSFVRACDSSDGYATVYMPEDRDIKIMILSDPQVDYYEKYKVVGSPGNDTTYDFIEDFVKETSPDLVIINGDLVMNDMIIASSSPYFERYAEIFERLQVPWAFTFGNHDLDGKYRIDDVEFEDDIFQCSKSTLIDYFEQNYPHCLINSDDGCLDGDGNYFINIRKKSGELVYTLCLLDCTYNKETSSYNYVPTANQVSWYRNTVNAISDSEYGKDRGDNVVKSMIFTHVGIPEFKTAWTEAWNKGNPTENYYYGHYFNGNYTQKYGDMAEDEQIFAVAKALGSTTAIFMCHHHDNDFSVEYQGIRLTFGQHSGYSHNYRTTHTSHGNSPTDYSAWEGIDFSRVDNYGDKRGGTQLTISVAGAFDIQPVLARNTLSNYAEKYYIDYDAVAKALDENSKYYGTVARGEGRAWKLESLS